MAGSSAPRFGADDRLAALLGAGVSQRDVDELSAYVVALCQRLISSGQPWRDDIDATRHPLAPVGTDLLGVSDALAALTAQGTRPFAGVARAAFVATDLLHGLFDAAAISAADRSAYFGSLGTVSALLADDFNRLERTEFLQRYGHLRPGTYDVRSVRYADAADRYFGRRPRGDRTARRETRGRSASPNAGAWHVSWRTGRWRSPSTMS